MATLELEVPRKLVPLLEPRRYKAAHGGRGGAKSHFFGQLAVATNLAAPKRGVCIREVQNSIKDSVKNLIESKITRLGLSGHFDVMRDEIKGIGPHNKGSLIAFRGMQDYNADNIKSLEDFDWAWVEEAQSLSHRSWRLLRPTIRKPGSEIWCAWNPRWDTDAVDEFFRGANKPDDATCIEINWQDNPWFPDVLRKEMERDYAADPEMAEHVWGGGYEIVSEASYYAKLLAAAEREGRIGEFPYRPGQIVKTAWDIGLDDYMACWFIVDDGVMPTVVDYYEASGEDFAEFMSHCFPEVFRPPADDHRFDGWRAERSLADLKRDVPFKYGINYLPHDVKVREVGAGGRHRFQTLHMLGLKDIAKGVANGPEERIAATRRLLPNTRFHNSPRVQKGIKRLRQYSRKRNDQLGTYTTPLHDENSHGADAFGEYAVNVDIRLAPPPPPPKKPDEFALEIEKGRIVSNMNVEEIVRMKERLAKMGPKRGLRL